MTDAKAAAASQAVLRCEDRKLLERWKLACDKHHVKQFLVHGVLCECGTVYAGDIENHRIEEAVAETRALPASGQAAALSIIGNGDYSCACCGIGMYTPCEHWKQMASRYSEPPVEAVGQQGADAIELASATLTADEVRSAIAGSVRTQDDGKVVADEEAMTRLLNETLASKATPAGAAVGVEAVRTTLETHTWDDEDGCAGCGWTPDSEATWAEHILALLAAPRTEKPGGRR